VVRNPQFAWLVEVFAIDYVRHQNGGDERVIVTVARAFATDPTVHLLVWVQKRVGIYETVTLQRLQSVILPSSGTR
jgi:hypothetical protein